MRWTHRFRAIASPLLKPPAYRALFVLVLIGALLIATLPEAAFVLPAIDAIGLDIVTIFAALELRHYVATMALLVGIPASVAIYLRVPGLWPYACMWPVIWIRTLMGTLRA